MRVLSAEIANYEGKEVELKGWVDSRRDHGKIIFIDLRDRKGVCQLVFVPQAREVYKKGDELRAEWVIGVKGKVKRRPEGMENPKIESGNYEVEVSSLEIFSRADTLPISISGNGYEIGEEGRMEHRYLDLRRPRLQRNIKVRHKIMKLVRDFLTEQEFVEIETPILGKSTPEGARDFLVPSRLHPGKFYALPQSPQQYKQLLMVAGFERYFQIAKCFRDEDTRGDRQPEFTQIDLEMSFADEEEILGVIEKLFIFLVEKIFPDKKIVLDKNGKIPRLAYKEVMEKYGTDRPDIRKDKNNPDELAPLFVVSFPAFEWKEGDRRWGATHHPFTMPVVEGADDLRKKFKENPASIEARQYDLVLNGYEIGGGSIRIHDPELLSTVFEVLGYVRKEVEEKFGHLLKAFKYGVPPHGGIAIGFDRMIAVLFNEPNIREVIAFPKTGDGRDLMMIAPNEVEKDQLKELHIKIIKDEYE